MIIADTRYRRRKRIFSNRLLIVSFIIVVILFFSITFTSFVILHQKFDRSTSLTSFRLIYIDVGCSNGETVEHFLHFYPNSSAYRIITFEPDPNNYRLCEQTLKQEKYSHLNIEILPKAVWIRNEKVRFRMGRIDQSNETNGIELDAIDFSSWLAQLTREEATKIHLKISAPGVEVAVLEKMILDETLMLPDRYEIEWIDRSDPRIRPTRIYVQLMLDGLGFDSLYYTRLDDRRQVYQRNGTLDEVKKFYAWKSIEESDTFIHYVKRPDHLEKTSRKSSRT